MSIRVSASRLVSALVAAVPSASNRRTRTSTGAPPLNCTLPLVASQDDSAVAVPVARTVSASTRALSLIQLLDVASQRRSVTCSLARFRTSRSVAAATSTPACSSVSSIVSVPVPAFAMALAAKTIGDSVAEVLPARRT